MEQVTLEKKKEKVPLIRVLTVEELRIFIVEFIDKNITEECNCKLEP